MMVQGLASQILWIIPTFIGKIPEPEERLGQERLEQENIIRNIELGPGQAQEKVGALTDNLSSAPLEKNWNRLLSLQGVFANIGINILNVSLPGKVGDFLIIILFQYLGKWIFWTIALSLPNL